MAEQAYRLQRLPEELPWHCYPICVHSGTCHSSALHTYCLCHDREEAWTLMLLWKHFAILNGVGLVPDVHDLVYLPQDLLTQVDPGFGGTSLVAGLCSEPMRMLALLFLWALCLRIKRTVGSLPRMLEKLPDELLAIVKPQHVVQWIHAHLPRSDPKTDSFVIFAFDEVLHCFNHPCLNLSQRFLSMLSSPVGWLTCDANPMSNPSWPREARLTPRPDLS